MNPLLDVNANAAQAVLRPGMIDLGLGYPDPTLLPVEAIQRASQRVLADWGSVALEYGGNAGPGPLLAWLIAHFGALEHQEIAPDEIMVTGGISQCLDQLLHLYTQPGDVVLVESPTYHLGVRILRDHPLQLRPVACDDEGLCVDRLQEILAELHQQGKRARALYTVPTFNNPTGRSLSLERRKQLVDIAASEDLLILEDDAYRELNYDGPALPSLWSLARRGTVARMGSFSKTLAPGLRVGFLTAGREIIQRILDCGVLDSGGGHNHFVALQVAALCVNGDYAPQVAKLRAEYRLRRDALDVALRQHMPTGCTWQNPAGGFFLWLRLPNSLDSAALLPHANAQGVAYIPGARSHLDGGGRDFLRMAFTLFPSEQLAEAARRLGALLTEDGRR